ncbi:E3 ubiquitin-protein ligase rnf146-like [Cyclopterus lumpus]|uniref:E3 ubiquitin-protein ligase n=1 Tax=Cyclopterus lumpus TaxID=8103 RepID=A0A8C2Z0F0_CYCLU|nr:E3 ubiquitin-protein ligase rnf146-like [Cyclopterus lumpus]
MASCGEVDHSVSSLPSSKKGNSNGGGGSGNSAESSCSGSSNSSLSVPECAICLQSCVHPVQLPCHHVFCFLCVKGASWQSKRCALCRQEVPDDFLERPTLLSPEELKASAGGRGGAASDHAWYYEGRNGWWQYDERTSRELEDAFSKGKKTAEMLIAGFLYVADLENMVQYRRNEHGRRRKMKRDVLDIPKKGVAGLRLDTEGVIGAAGRENSADGADTTVAGAQQPVTGIPSTVIAPPAAARPPTSLGGQPGSGSPTLEDALSQLQISPRPTPSNERAGEGEEVDEEEEVSPSRSSDPHTSVDESGSGDWSDDEEEEDEEEGGDGERVEPWEDRPRRQRLNPEDRSPPGAESASPPSSSSSGRSRMPDGQCTVTEV